MQISEIILVNHPFCHTATVPFTIYLFVVIWTISNYQLFSLYMPIYENSTSHIVEPCLTTCLIFSDVLHFMRYQRYLDNSECLNPRIWSQNCIESLLGHLILSFWMMYHGYHWFMPNSNFVGLLWCHGLNDDS
jgi:hypothetical protein